MARVLDSLSNSGYALLWCLRPHDMKTVYEEKPTIRLRQSRDGRHAVVAVFGYGNKQRCDWSQPIPTENSPPAISKGRKS